MDEAECQPHGRGAGVRPNFLLVAYGIQSHLNPCRVLARSLVQLHHVDGSGPVLATLSVPLFTHRRMFPSSGNGVLEEEATDGVISYAPYSDGVDDGSKSKDADERACRRRASSESLSAIVARLAARGRPVTCVVCSLVFPSALDVAREHAIPMAVFWIQPATVLAAYYHYFHGYGELIASHATEPAYEVTLPGLSQPLRIRDFPSFLVDTAGGETAKVVNDAFRELFEYMDEQGRQSAKFLVNTFEELEPAALAAMRQHLDVSAVGPVVGSSADARIHLFDHAGADKIRYMDWLGAQQETSVVYVSFGSIWTYSKQQMEEIAHGLRQCGRPYLLVVRKDARQEDVSRCLDEVVQEGRGMVVEWCDQPAVLSHPSVGCFVTHCGWNSTLEAVALGVPVVAAPSMFDQPTNAFLIEEQWGAGVRGERNGDGVFAGEELARCVELVMGSGARAVEIRKRVEALKGMARVTMASAGPAERSLRSFVTAANATDKTSTKDTTNQVGIDEII